MNEITWKSGRGEEIKIAVAAYLLDNVVVRASINGRMEIPDKPYILKSPLNVGGNIVVGTIGKIGLTKERLDQVRALMAAVQAEIDANPEVQLRKLISARQDLVSRIGWIRDAAHEAHVRFINRASANGRAAKSARDYNAEIAAAGAALAEFDAAHPEIVAKVAADKACATDHFLAID